MTSRGPLPLLAFALVACTAQGALTRVVVADRGSILRTISDPRTLQALERVWQYREEAEPSEAFNVLLGVPNMPLQPTRAAGPNGQREPAGNSPRG